MKKTLLVLAAMFSAVFVQAQTEQGSMIVGGDISLDFQTNKVESGGNSVDVGKTNTIEFSPQFGYFISDGLAVGAEVLYQSITFKPDGGGNDTKASVVALGPFVKYYLDNGVFAQANFGFGSSKTDFGSGEVKSSITLWRIGAGYAAFLNDHVAVEPMLSYGSIQQKNKDTDVKDIDNGFMISVGFTIFLN